MAIVQKPMQPLLKKLQISGFNPTFVRSLLPEWWDDSIADTPSGFQQTTLILGKILALRPDSLWDEFSVPVFALPESRKFKRRSDIEEETLDVACALAFSAARIVLSGLNAPSEAINVPDAGVLRKKLLANSKWIGFSDLLGYCFSIGIPVIHLGRFPTKAKKMDGLAFDCQGRPVIVLTKRSTHGYLLFDLAHELGHIALKHLKPGGCIIDQKIDADAEDEDERAANRFALELLTGDAECRIVPAGRNLTGSELANAAVRHGEANQIDPTHVALNYGHSHGHWPVAINAVKQIVGASPTDQEFIRAKLFASLDQDSMKEDDLAVLSKMVCEAG
jgi:hypothetical protein